MDASTKLSFTKWDRQINHPVLAHIELSNLYLKVERGDVKLDTKTGNSLWQLVREAFPKEHRSNDWASKIVQDYWDDELEKLPGWNAW